MPQTKSLIALDVGEKRIGVALADTAVKIAVPYETIDVDGDELTSLIDIITREQATTVVVGFPRNQSGVATAQTQAVKDFAARLDDIEDIDVVFQDESLTSVLAEERLARHKQPYTKADIDATAAAIILQDYIEAHHG